MNFRLVPKSVTLNSVMAVIFFISSNSADFVAHCVKVVEDTPVLSAIEMLPKESSFSDISLMTIFAEVTENKAHARYRYSPLLTVKLRL